MADLTLDDLRASRQKLLGTSQPPPPTAQSDLSLDDLRSGRQRIINNGNATPPQDISEAPPTAHDAFRAGFEQMIRNSPPYRWAYDNLPALKQSDQQYGYTPLTDEQYQKKYGDNGFATTGQAVAGTLLAAPAVAATELVAAPLAAGLAAQRLVAGAPTVLKAARFGAPAVTSLIGPISETSYPLAASAVRIGTNALQGGLGAAITGGNPLTGAVAGAAVPMVAQGMGAIGNSGGLNYLTDNRFVNALTHAAGMGLGWEQGDVLGALLGDRLATLTKAVGVPLANSALRAAGAVGDFSAAPAGVAAGQYPVPGL